MCVSDVVKNLMLNCSIQCQELMKQDTELMKQEWHKMCKCKSRLDSSVCNNKQSWSDDKCKCECKELIDKGVCDKGSIWNPSNCECEYYKLNHVMLVSI